MGESTDFEAVLSRLDEIAAMKGAERAAAAKVLAAEQLDLAEAVLEAWVVAHGGVPTEEKREGFRLLALHRQGAKGDPSFNACRETCREAVYHHNLILAGSTRAELERAVLLMSLVVRHLALFISGKLEVAGLGEFCCASKPLRLSEPAAIDT